MSRSCISIDVFRRYAHFLDTIHTALAHGTTAHTACEKYRAGVEPPTPSATVEVVGVAVAPWLHRTQRLRSFGARESLRTFCSPRAASAWEAHVPEAQKVVQAMNDGLRATSFISWQRPVAMGWSAG